MSRPRRKLPGEQGRVTAFLAAGMAGLLLLAGLVLDGGLALGAKIYSIGQAQEAARAGAQQIDLAAYRTDGRLILSQQAARAAAHDYLQAAGATGTVTVADTTVTVTVTHVHSTQLLGLAGIASITVTGSGTAEPHRSLTSTARP